jgi:hypothetical protein
VTTIGCFNLYGGAAEDTPFKRNNSLRWLGLVILFCCGAAHAEGARIGLEYESEKDNKTGMMNDAFTLKHYRFPCTNERRGVPEEAHDVPGQPSHVLMVNRPWGKFETQ